MFPPGLWEARHKIFCEGNTEWPVSQKCTTITSLRGIKAHKGTNASCEAQIPPCEAQIPPCEAQLPNIQALVPPLHTLVPPLES